MLPAKQEPSVIPSVEADDPLGEHPIFYKHGGHDFIGQMTEAIGATEPADALKARDAAQNLSAKPNLPEDPPRKKELLFRENSRLITQRVMLPLLGRLVSASPPPAMILSLLNALLCVGSTYPAHS
jgi:hypothetical protein